MCIRDRYKRAWPFPSAVASRWARCQPAAVAMRWSAVTIAGLGLHDCPTSTGNAGASPTVGSGTPLAATAPNPVVGIAQANARPEDGPLAAAWVAALSPTVGPDTRLAATPAT